MCIKTYKLIFKICIKVPLRTKRAFNNDKKALFIIFKGLSMKQIRKLFGRWVPDFKIWSKLLLTIEELELKWCGKISGKKLIQEWSGIIMHRKLSIFMNLKNILQVSVYNYCPEKKTLATIFFLSNMKQNIWKGYYDSSTPF